LIAKVAEHVRKVHKVNTPTDTIVNYVKTKVRR
jgi:predicted small metal-binding protein